MIFTVAAKELKALFASPLAWVLLTVMQLLLAYTFLRRLDDGRLGRCRSARELYGPCGPPVVRAIG